MTIVVFPNNTVSFRDTETEERIDNSYSYDEVKSMFGFTDERQGNMQCDPRKLSIDGHICVLYPTVAMRSFRDNKPEYEVLSSVIELPVKKTISKSLKQYRKQRRKKKRMLKGIRNAYEMKKEAVS